MTEDVYPEDPKSPNKMIDDAIRVLMRTVDTNKEPMDTRIKIVNTAISWEKVKHHINGKGDEFDPEDL